MTRFSCLAAMAIMVLFAGCQAPKTEAGAGEVTSDPGQGAELNPPGSAEIESFSHPEPGDWWQYDVVVGPSSWLVNLTYSDATGVSMFVIDNLDVGRILAVNHISLIAHEFTNWTWRGTWYEQDGAQLLEHNQEMFWAPELIDGNQAGSRDAGVLVASQAGALHYDYRGKFTGSASFHAGVGWFTEFSVPDLQMNWALRDHGKGWSGASWQLIQRNTMSAELGGVHAIEFEGNGGNFVAVTGQISCPLPGAVRHDITPYLAPHEPFYSRTYECPTDALLADGKKIPTQGGAIRHQILPTSVETWSGVVKITMLKEIAV